MNLSKKLEYLDVEDHFTTYDLGLSASLVCFGFEIVAIDKTNPRKAQFVFRKYHDAMGSIETCVDSYWNGKMTVEARQLVDSMKMLKNRLHSS